jgi:type III pantothenate kinase
MLHPWLALVIGNSRLHWALFADQALIATWHTPHLTLPQMQRLVADQFSPPAWHPLTVPVALANLPAVSLWLASVVPAQTQLWQQSGLLIHTVERQQIPLSGLYETLGLDRILTLWGASERYGWPVLVIDAGTALTLTAGDRNQVLGGAILPGLSLQARALHQGTAALPPMSFEALTRLPERWATDTVTAIHSGILYTLLAGIRDYLADWQQLHPQGKAILTGGDAPLLHRLIQPTSDQLQMDLNLMFWGMRAYRTAATSTG